MEGSVRAVELILNYRFKNRALLEDALTHSSYTDAPSYQRLEFLGDAVIGLAISNFVYLQYPDLDPGKLSHIRAVNISTERLARVAVRHQLYRYVRHNAEALSDKVREFVDAVEEEEATEIYGGLMKAPKILADIVESVIAAVYVDCGFNLSAMWLICRVLFEPLVLFDEVEKQPQPVSMLFELCQKGGRQIDIKYWRNGDRIIASVYVDGYLVASGSSDQKENAKLHAAEAALKKLSNLRSNGDMIVTMCGEFHGENDIEGPKQKLYELCGKKKWPKPIYRIEKEEGPAHERRYVCSVRCEASYGILFEVGDKRSKIKDAENSAASMMLRALSESNWI